MLQWRNGYIRQDRIRNEIIREKMEMCSVNTWRLEVDEESVDRLIIRGKGETKESYKRNYNIDLGAVLFCNFGSLNMIG